MLTKILPLNQDGSRKSFHNYRITATRSLTNLGKTVRLPAIAKNKLFLVTVVLPTLLSAIYFGLIASDVYVSESRFIVRGPEKESSSSSLGSILGSTSFSGFSGLSGSQDDTYSVQNFMLSRDALRQLDKTLDLRKAFAGDGIDIFSRFAGLDWWNNNFENLYLYYQEKVEIEIDSLSPITTLTTKGFTAEQAFRMNQQLLEMGEELVNRLNDVAQQDMIRFAEGEVRNAEEKAKAAALALSAYRNKKSVIDPESQATIYLEHLANLRDQLVVAQGMLVQLQTFAKNNPQIPSLKKRVEHLKQEIRTKAAEIAGKDRSLAQKSAEYQRLALEREFANTELGSTLSSLEQARNEAQRKQLYLERIVQPSKPDVAMEPRRIRGVLATLALSLITWGILTMLIAGVKEHVD